MDAQGGEAGLHRPPPSRGDHQVEGLGPSERAPTPAGSAFARSSSWCTTQSKPPSTAGTSSTLAACTNTLSCYNRFFFLVLNLVTLVFLTLLQVVFDFVWWEQRQKLFETSSNKREDPMICWFSNQTNSIFRYIVTQRRTRQNRLIGSQIFRSYK